MAVASFRVFSAFAPKASRDWWPNLPKRREALVAKYRSTSSPPALRRSSARATSASSASAACQRRQKLAHQLQSGVLVALGLDQHIENLGVDGAPCMNRVPIDFSDRLRQDPCQTACGFGRRFTLMRGAVIGLK